MFRSRSAMPLAGCSGEDLERERRRPNRAIFALQPDGSDGIACSRVPRTCHVSVSAPRGASQTRRGRRLPIDRSGKRRPGSFVAARNRILPLHGLKRPAGPTVVLTAHSKEISIAPAARSERLCPNASVAGRWHRLRQCGAQSKSRSRACGGTGPASSFRGRRAVCPSAAPAGS